METYYKDLLLEIRRMNGYLSRIADSLQEYETAIDSLDDLSNCVGVYPVCMPDGTRENSYRFDIESH